MMHQIGPQLQEEKQLRRGLGPPPPSFPEQLAVDFRDALGRDFGPPVVR